MRPMSKKALIAVGSNVASEDGSPESLVKKGINASADFGWRIIAQSRFYRTPCFPAGAGDDYVNAAFAVEADDSRSPAQLLADLHQIEARYGRARAQRWGSRTLDLDLIAWGDAVLPDASAVAAWIELPAETQQRAAPDQLILPHPRLQDRSFVLVPLADVAPDWTHPILGKTVARMLSDRPNAERAEVRALPGGEPA